MTPWFVLDDGQHLRSTVFREGAFEKNSPCLITVPFPGEAGAIWKDFPLWTRWEVCESEAHADENVPGDPPRALDVRFHPQRDAFFQRVERALKAIRSGRFSKVVVARAVEVRLSRRFRPEEILHRFRAARGSGETVFLVAHPRGLFFGMTPECLFRFRGQNIEVDLIAGTSSTPRDLNHPHLVEEHALVGEGVVESLRDLLASHEILSLPPIQAGPVWHLHSRLVGRLREGVPWHAVLHRLHPTPALAGYPRDEAQRWIQSEEKGLRGLYGGVVGWVRKDAGAFYVAIRCALLRDRRLYLFAGGGVVKGHTPEELWEETNLKMSRVASLLMRERLFA